MKHEMYDKHYEPATAIEAEGARVGLATCRICGAVVLVDPRDDINRLQQHVEWHEVQDQ
jgi:hypothetical protein